MCYKVHLVVNNAKIYTNMAAIKVFQDYQTALNVADYMNKRRTIFAKMTGLKWFVKTFDVIHGKAVKQGK